MKDFLSIACKILASISGGWMVNQLPEINKLPIDIPDWFVLMLATLVFIALIILDQKITDNQFKDQVKPLKHAISIVLVSFLASACVFMFSINAIAPEELKKVFQYAAVSLFSFGLILAATKVAFFTRENPEESRDAFEESLLQAQSIISKTNQVIVQPVVKLSSSEVIRTYLRRNLEQQEYLKGRILELKNRFRYRNEALIFLEEIVKEKKISKEVSQSILNSYAVSIENHAEAERMKEKFRLQINFALKVLSIAVKYGRPNAFEKTFGSQFSSEFILEKNIYLTAFQLTEQRVQEIAMKNCLSSGAIAQIELRFDDLIQFFEPINLSIP